MRARDTTPERFLKGLTLGGPLGQGGMSRVCEADTVDGRRVAVKFPRLNGVAGHAAGQALVRREFGFLSEISHPNVVSVLGLVRISKWQDGLNRQCGHGASVSTPGMVMEYLDGGDLVSMAGGPPRIWAPVAARTACAVDHLHRSGIVHRDLKPRNVLMRGGDVPCLIDFALAARIGDPVPRGGGTAAYRRRKSADRADVADMADDVYALAVLVYELWVGDLPFGRRPRRGNGARRRELPALRPVPGVRGLRGLAMVLSDILNERDAALSRGVGPLRHALEWVVEHLAR